MKKLKFAVAALTLLAGGIASAGTIIDTGANAYWGGNDHGYGDVIGSSMYDIKSADLRLDSGWLSVIINTNFAGHAGADTWANPKGIGYGDLFLANAWNVAGTDAHNKNDNAKTGTKWNYGLSLDNRWSNTGGSFTLYALNGANNEADILNSERFMSCALGKNCYFRDGQATAVNTGSVSVKSTGMTGKWTVTANKSLQFVIDVRGTELANAGELAMHWGETCQNDVIEGVVDVPEPSGIALAGLGLGLLALRRRKARAAA
jgi:hypothetical protein